MFLIQCFAEDIQPNRLEKAKQAIARLVEKLADDKIGLIVFAGDAYVQMPVTSDYTSVKMSFHPLIHRLFQTGYCHWLCNRPGY